MPWPAQGYKDAHKFDPERFSEERKEDVSCSKHFLTFGLGPHGCVGREYATNHLVAFLAILSTSAGAQPVSCFLPQRQGPEWQGVVCTRA